ncbi:MAG: hypothetical protein M1492_07960 [Gammaproteobacteria bacterium]|jgi:hypothetical protein|nr:hypothetical protein [Gammaproteobacteria bacterium]
MEFNAGDIVKVPFPMHDGTTKPHYGIVSRVEKGFGGDLVTVVYGSSKKVSVSGHPDNEMVLHLPKDLTFAGLYKPTRFDFRVTAQFPARLCVPVGKLDLTNPLMVNALKGAMRAAYSPG